MSSTIHDITTMQRVASDQPYSRLQCCAWFTSRGCQSALVTILQHLLATLKSAAELELSNAHRDSSNGAGVASCSSVARKMDSVERSRMRRQSRRTSDAKDSAPAHCVRDAYRSCTERDGPVLTGRKALDTRGAHHKKLPAPVLTDPLGEEDTGHQVDSVPRLELEGSAIILDDGALAEAAQGSGAEGAGEIRKSSANEVSVGYFTGSEINTSDGGGDSAAAGLSVTVTAERKSAAAAKAHELAAAKFARMKIAAEAKSADSTSAGSSNPRASLAGECVAHRGRARPFLKVYGWWPWMAPGCSCWRWFRRLKLSASAIGPKIGSRQDPTQSY